MSTSWDWWVYIRWFGAKHSAPGQPRPQRSGLGLAAALLEAHEGLARERPRALTVTVDETTADTVSLTVSDVAPETVVVNGLSAEQVEHSPERGEWTTAEDGVTVRVGGGFM